MFDAKQGRSIHERCLAALKPLEKELGVLITANGFIYGMTLTIKFNIDSPGNSEDDRMQRSLPAALKIHGLPDTLAGQTLTINGKEFTLFGYRPTRGTKPFVLRRDGKFYTSSVNTIRVAAGLAQPSLKLSVR